MVFWVQRKAVAIELDWHFRLIPSRERKRATSFHRPQGARNTKLNALVPVTSSSEAMNLVFRVQKRLVERVARLRSRLGIGLSRQGVEPGVPGPEASWCEGRSLALAARYRTFTPGR